ncbi:ATP synthase complex subunit H-domain-containing protein [Flagelloscypha sp. PMI_526]|nr:ATP synthase complex subunit H-domain-containing protein [Flagelloscypha sp. PMI_526]
MSGIVFRQTSAAVRSTSARCLLSTSAVRKDLVKDVYINALKGYKPTPVPKDAHVGNVKAYSTPSAPQAPTLPTDIASELSAYDAAEPTKVSAAPTSADASTEADGAAFLEMLEAPEVEEEHHH